MADEIKDNALVEEALADIGLNALELEAQEKEKRKATKKQHKRTVIHNAGVIELMLSDQIVQLKGSMDPLFLMFFDKEVGNCDAF